MTNVQPAELTGYQQQAAELHRIADALASGPDGAKPYFSLTVIVAENAPDVVDALATALLGKPGKLQASGGDWYHNVQHYTSDRALNIQSKVSGPPDERDAELEQLRAENARLRAAADLTGLNYGRGDEGADAQPSAGRVPPHLEDGRTGEVSCTCPLGPEDAHLNDCPQFDTPEIVHMGDDYLLPICGAAPADERLVMAFSASQVTCPSCLKMADSASAE